MNNNYYSLSWTVRYFTNFLIKLVCWCLRQKKPRGLDYKLVVSYKNNNNCLLAQLCCKYGSDKWSIYQLPESFEKPYSWLPHTYADYYSRLFSHCRQSIKSIFECWLGTNNEKLPSSMGKNGKPWASLRVWRDYFPNACIFGADIDKDILFEEERIRTFYIDQLDPLAINLFWGKIQKTEFDFMIDDWLHTFDAGICLFHNSVWKLAATGIYVIEDVCLSDLWKYKIYFSDKNFIVDYVNLYRPNTNLWDNNLVVIRKNISM